LSTLFQTSIASNLGVVKLTWVEDPNGPKAHRIILPQDKRIHDDNPEIEELAVVASPLAIAELAHNIQSLLGGQDIQFDLKILDLTECREFQLKVLVAEYAVPRGYVTTYGRIAHHLGIHGGARAVGGALSSNPFPLVIPCHRAIRSNGQLGGFQGGVRMKESLLRMEGVLFQADRKVIMDNVYY